MAGEKKRPDPKVRPESPLGSLGDRAAPREEGRSGVQERAPSRGPAEGGSAGSAAGESDGARWRGHPRPGDGAAGVRVYRQTVQNGLSASAMASTRDRPMSFSMRSSISASAARCFWASP